MPAPPPLLEDVTALAEADEVMAESVAFIDIEPLVLLPVDTSVLLDKTVSDVG